MRRSFISGFTLAEVLITLTIIGVIAALTIPSLIQNIQDAQLKTAWKENYALLDHAVKLMVNDNGGDLTGAFVSSNNLANKMASYLSYTKKCPFGSSTDNCWHSGQNLRRLNGSSESFWANDNDPGFVLNNGALLYIYFRSNTCSDTSGGQLAFNECGQIMVDVNGFNGPNTIGKDVYGVWVKKDGIVPYGVLGDNWTNWTSISSCRSGYIGWGCSAQYLYQ